MAFVQYDIRAQAVQGAFMPDKLPYHQLLSIILLAKVSLHNTFLDGSRRRLVVRFTESTKVPAAQALSSKKMIPARNMHRSSPVETSASTTSSSMPLSVMATSQPSNDMEAAGYGAASTIKGVYVYSDTTQYSAEELQAAQMNSPTAMCISPISPMYMQVHYYAPMPRPAYSYPEAGAYATHYEHPPSRGASTTQEDYRSRRSTGPRKSASRPSPSAKASSTSTKLAKKSFRP
jgi:hypothetical protein